MKPIKILDDYGNNALEQNNIQDLMSEVISKMSQDIEQKRLDLITNRLKELGVEIDFKTEANRRFKRFAIVYSGNEEIVYYNDGSIDGIRIITFVKKENPIEFEKGSVKMNYELNYY